MAANIELAAILRDTAPSPFGLRRAPQEEGGDWFRMTKELEMTGPEVLDVARDAILTLVLVSAPLMLVGLIVGVIISLFQALTQIQEQTIVYVPKILAIFAAMLIALPFMGDILQGHMTRIAARIMGG
jgi:flagellar biosynthetic protein FliQ